MIAFSPVVESGWDTVLREAKAAKIPVVLTDRAVNTKDDLAVRHLHGLGLRRGRPQGRPLAGREDEGQDGRRQHRRTAGHRGLGPGDRPQEGLRGNHQGRPALQDHPLADRRLHPRQGQGSDGSLPEGRGQEDQRALRAQRRHGHRRDPGHRGSGHEAGQGHHHHLDRRGQGRLRGHDRRQAQRVASNAARCWARS